MPKFSVEFLPIAQDHPVPQPETAALLSAPKNRPRHALSKAPDPIRPTDRQTTAKALVKTHPPTDNQATAKAPAGAICPQTTRPPPKGSTGTHLPSDNQITAKGPIGTPAVSTSPGPIPETTASPPSKPANPPKPRFCPGRTQTSKAAPTIFQSHKPLRHYLQCSSRRTTRPSPTVTWPRSSAFRTPASTASAMEVPVRAKPNSRYTSRIRSSWGRLICRRSR